MKKGNSVVVLRGDIDALPITENTGLPFSSLNEGVMHACGHDIHATCVLGAGRILNEIKGDFGGKVKLLFQPGEEKLPGGATKVLASGILDRERPDAIIAQHVFPELESGKIGFRPGLYMASADEIYIRVEGPGGHAAMPEKTVDSVFIASRLIVAMKEAVGRLDKGIPTVLTFGKIEGRGATNVIPMLVSIEGTFRTMDEDWRSRVHNILSETASALAGETSAKISVEIRKGYPCLINNETLTADLRELGREALGSDRVVDLGLRMTSEDFAFYTAKYKCCFYRLGVRKPGSTVTMLHSPAFNADEDAIATGVEFMVLAAIRILCGNGS